jgi:SEC-C motif-containing protein
LDQVEAAPTAEALMRSRYSAYVLRNEPYLLATWHVSTRPESLELADDATKWIGLEIKRSEAGGPGDERGLVEFVARYKVGGRAFRLHETSRFVREDGRWYYVDGDIA